MSLEIWEEWAAEEGPAVLARARQYPPTKHVVIEGEKYHVLGYPEEEDGRIGLWVSKFQPRTDYERAVSEKIFICPDHLIAEEQGEEQLGLWQTILRS